MYSLYVTFFVFTIVSISVLSFLTKNKNINGFLFFLVFILGCIVLILRDPMASNDSINYSWMYDNSKKLFEALSMYHHNYFFSITMYLGNCFSLTYNEYEIILSVLMLAITSLGVYFIIPNRSYYIVSISFFIFSSTFILLFTNVLRQGLALSLFILALGLLLQKRKKTSVVILLLAYLSHSSMVVIVLAFFIYLLFFDRIKTNQYFRFYLILPLIMGLGKFVQIILPIDFINKIMSMSEMSYNNSIVYVKVVILYFTFLYASYLGVRLEDKDRGVLNSLLFISWFLFSIIFAFYNSTLLISRFLYYISGLSPIVLVFILYNVKWSIYVKSFILIVLQICFGFFVFTYKSTVSQLGLFW